ncbi:restriction endonuclease subunit S [Slackia isoflavoniconvertens]|uniref:restriction endonuclease subunit S n=1 Tax=Slackia isoflavoniconvertens TaxID=572010 RepID=UPI003D03D0E5
MITLSEVADIQTGPFGSQLHKEDYVAEGTPIVTVEHLGGRFFTRQNLPFVDDDDAERLKKYRMKRGDIIYSRVGSVDRCSYAEEENEGWLFSGRCLRVRPKSEINSEFLYYYLSSKEVKRFVKGIAVGATMPSINTALMGEIPIPDLPAHQQAFIAAVMTPIDRKIAINAKINGYLEELLLAQFTALSPNENWTEGRADSYYEIGIGKTPPRKEPEWFSDVKADNHVWLSIKDMGEAGAYSLDSSEYLTDAAVNAKNVRRVPAGSVLLSFKLTVGRVKIAGCNMTTNEAIACFASDDKRKLAYAYPYLRSFDYGELGSTSSIATAVNSKTVKAMPFAMPGDLELSEFYLSTKPIYEQLLATAKESRFLAQLRDVLLPKLMSGEIDVSKVDLKQLNSHLA